MRGLLILGSIVMVAASAVRSEDNLTKCADTLGVSRVAEVDTTGGALFGDQYPPTTLLQKGEVVLTFDDGPNPKTTSTSRCCRSGRRARSRSGGAYDRNSYLVASQSRGSVTGDRDETGRERFQH